jgi:hypothetical protein
MAQSKTVAAQDGPFSIGSYLRSQRKIRGIELEELSVRTRIPLRSLTRLEEGAFDGTADGFVRGFVRTVAVGLGLDPDDTLMRMLDEPRSQRSPHVRAGLSPRTWLALATALAATLAGALLLHAALWTGRASTTAEIVIRRDPVRALAEADAAAPKPAARPGDPAR